MAHILLVGALVHVSIGKHLRAMSMLDPFHHLPLKIIRITESITYIILLLLDYIDISQCIFLEGQEMPGYPLQNSFSDYQGLYFWVVYHL